VPQVKEDLKECSPKCTHKPQEQGCRKFMWTASVHKDEWETTLWQDSQLIISFGNFFSSTRAGLLARGASGEEESFHTWCPEPIWHYNIEGRSATDSADQARKKLTLAERRNVRAGPKGISFVLDIAFTNGAVLQRMLQPATMPRAQLDKKYTKVLFTLKWASSVLQRVAHSPFRLQKKCDYHIVAPSVSSSSVVPSAPTNMKEHHILVDLPLELRAAEKQRKKGRGRPPKQARVFDRRGMCAGGYDQLGVFKPCGRHDLPKRTQYFCQGCSRYFHMSCYFQTHFSMLMK